MNFVFDNKEAESFLQNGDTAEALKLLFSKQKQEWELLKKGVESLKDVQTKKFNFDGFEIKLQFNAGRIHSSAAKVDEKTISERRCFLCPENLPGEQQGILFDDKYLLLCNPYPIFNEHFTLSSLEHEPQQIKNSFGSFLELSRSLSKYYSVFYNGPKCGASAPDHLHFQSGLKNFLPIYKDFELLKMKYGKIISSESNAAVNAIDDGIRKIISIEADEKKEAEKYFNLLYESFSSLNNNDEEPLMNLISWYEDKWIIIILLRETHRPAQFYASGEEKILLSPASVDLGGVPVTPLEKDFKKITKELIADMFRQVSLEEEKFKVVTEKLSR
jgi:ATP adenylyltransferase/5',5'''-P-1,P-4-tetraphosphate phosphorylase II